MAVLSFLPSRVIVFTRTKEGAFEVLTEDGKALAVREFEDRADMDARRLEPGRCPVAPRLASGKSRRGTGISRHLVAPGGSERAAT